MSSELKPCPVKTCGSVNVVYQLDIPFGARVKCLACGASGLEAFPIRGKNGLETYDDLKSRVTKAWNTRAPMELSDSYWWDFYIMLDNANMKSTVDNGDIVKDIANAARAWLAANVHDSGDSDAARYRFCRDNWSKLTTATLYGERGHYVEQIYLNTFGLPLLPESIDAAIDAAILAEKGI